MRKKGEKGAPTAAQMKRAQGEQKEAYDIGHDYANYASKIHQENQIMTLIFQVVNINQVILKII